MRGYDLGAGDLDLRQRRRVGGQAREQRLDRRRLALRLDHRAALVVAHEPGEPQLTRQPVHERPEADALNDALDPYPHALDRGGHSRGRSRRSLRTRPNSTWSARNTARSAPCGQRACLSPSAGATTASNPSHASTPYAGPAHGLRRTRSGSRPKISPKDRSHPPVHQLDDRAAPPARDRPEQTLGLLAREPRRRVLADQCRGAARTSARRSWPSRRRCRGTSRGSSRPARRGRGTRSPVPPGCAGCAASA